MVSNASPFGNPKQASFQQSMEFSESWLFQSRESGFLVRHKCKHRMNVGDGGKKLVGTELGLSISDDPCCLEKSSAKLVKYFFVLFLLHLITQSALFSSSSSSLLAMLYCEGRQRRERSSRTRWTIWTLWPTWTTRHKGNCLRWWCCCCWWWW